MDIRPNGPQIAVFMDFENVATSAEASFGSFDVTAVMDLLRTRGRLLIKRAYGDWGRFHRYRRAMLENGIDLFQLYSVGVQQKNRADVRLAIDALETVFTRPSIDLYVIISGDSDFTELIHKLRDHGKYTIGIGLRSATSDLLRRACDEFIFYETLVTEEAVDISDELRLPDPRELLRRALSAAEQKGELPIYAGRLKQIMLNLDSSFSEANYGYQQFRAFLEAYPDLVAVEEQGLQLFVSMRKPTPSPAAAPPLPKPSVEPAAAPRPAGGGSAAATPAASASAAAAPSAGRSQGEPDQRYRSFFRDAGLRIVDGATRRRVLADFLAAVEGHAEPLSLNDAADLLKDRYDAENALTFKLAVPDVMRLLIMSGALSFAGGQPSSDAPIQRAALPSLDELVRACERVYVWRLAEGGMPIDAAQLTRVMYSADTGKDAVVALCRALVAEGKIVPQGDGYAIAPEQIGRLLQRPELALPAGHLAREPLPAGEPISPHTAAGLFREASELRQKDFAGSAQRYLQAARIQLEALRTPQTRAGFDDLKWYLASYCSVKAGHAFVSGN
ncbi:MAG: NYN domain-containing protein, partial [Anaerolineae bacterium]